MTVSAAIPATDAALGSGALSDGELVCGLCVLAQPARLSANTTTIGKSNLVRFLMISLPSSDTASR
jgi:hypothetical protein